MSYTMKSRGRYAVIELDGEIDLSTSPAARAMILDAVGEGRDVLVDLSAVAYMDSSGVASLVEGYQLARDRGTSFGLLDVSPAVLSVLQLARLDTVFPLYRTQADEIQPVN